MDEGQKRGKGDFLVSAQGKEYGVVPSGYEEQVRRLLRASVAQNTRRAYMSRLKNFFNWCGEENIFPVFPAKVETVVAYIAYLEQRGASFSTVAQSMAAITGIHRAEGFDSPTDSLLVKKALKGYRRLHGVAPKKKEAAPAEVVRLMLDALRQENSAKNIRDAALIAVGFAGAFRRSELVALNLEDLKWTMRDGEEILLITIRRSKTDQEGTGFVKAIFPSKDKDVSPTLLLKRWLALSGEKKGPVFRMVRKGGHVTDQRISGQKVAFVVQEAARKAGLQLDLSGHSLRSGFVTTAIRKNRSERSIMNQTGHRSSQTLRGYFQREDAVEDNAGRGLI